MPSIPSDQVANRLLAGLPSVDRERVLAGCEVVNLSLGEVLAEPGEPIRHVYFPIRAIISLTTRIDGRSSLEVGVIGDEGMLGTALVLGVDVSPMHAVVQGAGTALRMEAAAFRAELERSPALLDRLRRYIQVVIRQLGQTAACNRFHVVEARLARWLLMTRDRAHTDAFHVTHEFLAFLLGVRRVGVTKAATALQKRELIHYHRGELAIIDPAGLEAAACDCYAADKTSYDRGMR